MVPRRQAESLLDTIRNHSPYISPGIRIGNQVCRRKLGVGVESCLSILSRVRCKWKQAENSYKFFFLQKKVDMTLGPCAAYVVDLMHSRSAESLAANRSVLLFYYWSVRNRWESSKDWQRCIVLCVLFYWHWPLQLPFPWAMIDTYGIVMTNVLCAVLV